MNPIVETDFKDKTKRIHITVEPEKLGEQVHLTLVINSNGFILDVFRRSSEEVEFSTYKFWHNLVPTKNGEQQ